MVKEERKKHKRDFYKEIVPSYIEVAISPKSLKLPLLCHPSLGPRLVLNYQCQCLHGSRCVH